MPSKTTTLCCPACYSNNVVHTWRVDMDTLRYLDETLCGECHTRSLEWSEPFDPHVAGGVAIKDWLD